MQELTDQQKKKLLKLAEIADGGEFAITEELLKLDEKIDQITLENKGDKGERGEQGERGTDGRDGEKGEKGDSGRDGIDGKDGENGQDATLDYEKLFLDILSQVPAQVVESGETIVTKINTGDKLIERSKIEGLADIERMAKANAMPVTTMFVNGKRAKNIDFSGATVTYEGDKAIVTVQGGGGGTLAQTLALGNVTGGNNILLTTGDYLKSSAGNTQVDLSSSAFVVTTDAGGFSTPYIIANTSNIELAGPSNGGVLLNAGSVAIAHNTLIQFSTAPVRFTALTASNVPYLDASKNLVSSAVTPTQLSYLDATSSIQTQLNGKQAAGSYQPLDSDLTTIAGLTATTGNFIVSEASAWASRTPAQVRTTLGLVIGTNVQAYDADLTTWAGITPGANVGTFLATPTSANFLAAITDETGTGKVVFGTAPTFETSITGNYLTASRALISNASKQIVVSATTSTELGYLSGVTAGIQAQLDSKVPSVNGQDNPTVGTETNCSGTTVAGGQYHGVANVGGFTIITESFKMNTTATGAGATSVEFAPAISGIFTNAYDAVGTAVSASGESATVYAVASSQNIIVSWVAVNTGAQDWAVQFTMLKT